MIEVILLNAVCLSAITTRDRKHSANYFISFSYVNATVTGIEYNTAFYWNTKTIRYNSL